MKRALHKLRKISFDELFVRGSQRFCAFAERREWSRAAKLISDKEFLGRIDAKWTSALDFRDHFRERSEPHFFPAFDNPASTTAELRRRWPASANDIVGRADRMNEGRFDLLGLRNVSFGSPVNWHLEPVANKCAPLLHWSRLNYLDAEVFGDHKIIWELNRHQYFVTLGQAYWLTGDERYAETFGAHITSWMDQNPPKLGINWASSLEVAFRSISWLWALYFFRHSSALTPSLFLRICKFLYVNARHLETYPSTYFSPNTHLTGEALGLFYLGMLLPEFKESGRWRDSGMETLLAQLAHHVQPDGVYFEQSSYYHRYTADFYLHLWILLRGNKEPIPPQLDEKLRLLLDHLMVITRPDGTTPLFGDDDGGRLLTLSDRPANDFRATLATGAAVFKRPDYKFVSGGVSPEALWLLGPAGLADLERIEASEPARQSTAFEASGYYVMRDGWKKNSNYLLLDCGPHGADNCGHAHADALSFDLSVNGRTLIVDPGTYTYTGSKEMRDWFRSTPAHNTLSVDGESSSVPSGTFSWNTIARPVAWSWISEPRFDWIVASHDGFNRLSPPAIHKRSILFLKNDYWVVHDCVESTGPHKLQSWIHFDSGPLAVEVRGNAIHCPDVCQLVAFGGNGEWRQETGWVSHCYGIKAEAPVCLFTVPAQGSEELVTFLLPEVTGNPRPLAQEIHAVGGRAFEIVFQGKRDVLMLRNSQKAIGATRVETPRLASDFAVSWVRFDSLHASEPEEMVLIDGQTLELDGHRLETNRNGSDMFCYVRN